MQMWLNFLLIYFLLGVNHIGGHLMFRLRNINTLFLEDNMDFKLHVKWLSLFESELVDLLVYNQDQQNWDILDSLLPYNSLNLYKEEARKIEIGENETNIEQLKVRFA
jgi:hypothetical protein